MGCSKYVFVPLSSTKCVQVSRWWGPGNWNSGLGVVHVSVISANRALSPDRVDCQWPHKVSQVHSRGKVLLPWVTDSFFFFFFLFFFFLSAQFFLRLAVQSKAFAERSCAAFCPLRTWLPVCLCAWVKRKQTGRQFVCVTESDSVFCGGCLNGFTRALLNGKPPPVVFVHKEALLFLKGTIELFTESQRAQTTLSLPWRMLSHTAPSLCLSQCLSPLSNTKVGSETMVIPPLLFLFWMPSVKLKVNVFSLDYVFSLSFSSFWHNSLHIHYVSWGNMNKVYVTHSCEQKDK